MTDINALRELLGKATKGQWFWSGAGCILTEKYHSAVAIGANDGTPSIVVENQDAQLIVAAVNALPGLLDELEAGRKLRKAWRPECCDTCPSDALTAYDEAVTKG